MEEIKIEWKYEWMNQIYQRKKYIVAYIYRTYLDRPTWTHTHIHIFYLCTVYYIVLHNEEELDLTYFFLLFMPKIFVQIPLAKDNAKIIIIL